MSNSNETQVVDDVEYNHIAYLNPNIIDSEKIAISLIGENVTEIASYLNKNFISLIQKFYSYEKPINPLIGQEWLNKNDMLVYRWVGKNWVPIEKEKTFDCFLYVKFNITANEFIIDASVFNFTIDNIILYNQDMKKIKFVIDSFDSKKIILKESNITDLYILVFHPKDKITNPTYNKKTEIYTSSGQTQFDIEAILDGTDINTLSINLNDVRLENNEFSVVNNILTIDGSIYRIKTNDKLTIWGYGGSLSSYYSNLTVYTDNKTDKIKVPKFFRSIETIDFIDETKNVLLNPIKSIEYDDYYLFEFIESKKISIKTKIRII